jgi:hypothetical protein
MDFKVTDTKPMNKNTLQGVFSLMVGPLKIEGWTYHVKGDKSWVNPPSKEYIDRETGEKKYWPIIRIEDDERYHAFQRWAKEQVTEIFATSSPPIQEGHQENDSGIPF